MHVPTEIDDSNADEIQKVLNAYNLQMVQLCGHTWTAKQYKFGVLGNTDPKVRSAAIDRVKWALDMGARFNVPISVLWPATDGNDFPLQTDYVTLYDRYVDSVRQILDYLHENNYTTKICVEPKPFEPRSWIMMGTTAAALSIVQEVDDPNVGINIDVGHSLIAKENVEDMFSLVLRAKNNSTCISTITISRPIAISRQNVPTSFVWSESFMFWTRWDMTGGSAWICSLFAITP